VKKCEIEKSTYAANSRRWQKTEGKLQQNIRKTPHEPVYDVRFETTFEPV